MNVWHKLAKALLVPLLLDMAKGAYAWLRGKMQDMADKRRIKRENRLIRERNEAAKTSKERDEAARNLIDKF